MYLDFYIFYLYRLKRNSFNQICQRDLCYILNMASQKPVFDSDNIL